MKHNFKKLTIWQESIELVIETYKMTKTFQVKKNSACQVN